MDPETLGGHQTILCRWLSSEPGSQLIARQAVAESTHLGNAMETQLIEITNRMLFTEYLRHLGLRVPNLYQEWVCTNGRQVLARIQIGTEQPRFFINAAYMSLSRRPIPTKA